MPPSAPGGNARLHDGGDNGGAGCEIEVDGVPRDSRRRRAIARATRVWGRARLQPCRTAAKAKAALAAEGNGSSCQELFADEKRKSSAVCARCRRTGLRWM